MKWARYAEMILGMWLIAAPWFLDYGGSAEMSAVGAAAGILVLALAAISVLRVQSYAFLGILIVAAGLWGHAYFAVPPELAATQNHVAVALLLAMFAILPTETTREPHSWREFQRTQRN